MKAFVLSVLVLASSLPAKAQVRSRDPRSLPVCPASGLQFLLVTGFEPSRSADARVTKGTCTVLAPRLSWWETMPSKQPQLRTTEVACAKTDLLRKDPQVFVRAFVSYRLTVDDCRSNPGCHYTCEPEVFVRF